MHGVASERIATSPRRHQEIPPWRRPEGRPHPLRRPRRSYAWTTNAMRRRRAGVNCGPDVTKKKSSKTVAHNISGLKRGGPGRPKGVPNRVIGRSEGGGRGAGRRSPLPREVRAGSTGSARGAANRGDALALRVGKPKEIVELQERRDVPDYDLPTDEELEARLRRCSLKSRRKRAGIRVLLWSLPDSS